MRGNNNKMYFCKIIFLYSGLAWLVVGAWISWYTTTIENLSCSCIYGCNIKLKSGLSVCNNTTSPLNLIYKQQLPVYHENSSDIYKTRYPNMEMLVI